ncbi:MAG: hypothetical protein WA740_15350 [Candidatus Binataceae bacterium]
MDSVHILLVLALIIALFLAIRSFWWWYWGIGRMVAALEDIAVSLRQMPAVKEYDKSRADRSSARR